jgi:hypothetical protein
MLRRREHHHQQQQQQQRYQPQLHLAVRPQLRELRVACQRPPWVGLIRLRTGPQDRICSSASVSGGLLLPPSRSPRQINSEIGCER